MIITTSNVLLGLSPSITTGASSDVSSNLTDPDFSTVYVSSSQTKLTMEFGSIPNIGYVAVAGFNIAEGNKDREGELSRVRVYDGQTLLKTNQIIRDNCVVMTFDDRTFSNLRIGLRNFSGKANPVCTFVAAGSYITVPNSGEVGGYNRQFLSRNTKQKTTNNNLAAPVSILRKAIAAKGTLSLPNMTKAFSENEWQSFLDFSENNFFFIQEQQSELIAVNVNSGINSSAYLCYNVISNKVTAHQSTRQLNNISLGFNVYNGL